MKKALFVLFLLITQAGKSQVLIDSDPVSNYTGSEESYSGSIELYIAQSFSNTSSCTLASCQFYLSKSGSPTGIIYAYVYAHSGTYGSTSIPSGSALATSNAVDISTLSTSMQTIALTFSGVNQIWLSASTKYVLVVAYAGGNYNNRLNVGADWTTKGGSGNFSYSADGLTWSPYSGEDILFYVYGKLPGPTSISKVNSVTQATISKINGVTNATLTKINGIANQ